jgi:hypothetical protein
MDEFSQLRRLQTADWYRDKAIEFNKQGDQAEESGNIDVASDLYYKALLMSGQASVAGFREDAFKATEQEINELPTIGKEE